MKIYKMRRRTIAYKLPINISIQHLVSRVLEGQ